MACTVLNLFSKWIWGRNVVYNHVVYVVRMHSCVFVLVVSFCVQSFVVREGQTGRGLRPRSIIWIYSYSFVRVSGREEDYTVLTGCFLCIRATNEPHPWISNSRAGISNLDTIALEIRILSKIRTRHEDP